MTQFAPTRTDALVRLSAFVPKAGRLYASKRNYDHGPGHHETAVSLLSPYVRHRVITEDEILAAVLGRHAASSAEKFIQEVFWRTYWKGWLQLRPSVWSAYLEGRDGQAGRLAKDSALQRDYAKACDGATGIDAFDHWVHELVTTGYLHNHARMWFASIWIFTLRLPWQLGADFFLQHLLDGDPASNTLSWRWVGGLQTKGKTYLARPDNIAQYTEGRFAPNGLAKTAPSLDGPEHPPRLAPPVAAPWDSKQTSALLLTSEDLSPAFLFEQGLSPEATATFQDANALSSFGTSDRVAAFKRGAIEDVTRRWSDRLGPVQHCRSAQDIATWAAQTGAKQIVTPFAPVGPTATQLDELARRLADQDQTLVRVLRDYDALCWPHATHGFFKFKENIPKLISQIHGLTAA